MTHYIELHSASAFSFLEGASVPEELVDSCVAAEMPAMALLATATESTALHVFIWPRRRRVVMDNVVSVKADRVLPLAITHAVTQSHDFH
jgi:hypothetical protein